MASALVCRSHVPCDRRRLSAQRIEARGKPRQDRNRRSTASAARPRLAQQARAPSSARRSTVRPIRKRPVRSRKPKLSKGPPPGRQQPGPPGELHSVRAIRCRRKLRRVSPRAAGGRALRSGRASATAARCRTLLTFGDLPHGHDPSPASPRSARAAGSLEAGISRLRSSTAPQAWFATFSPPPGVLGAVLRSRRRAPAIVSYPILRRNGSSTAAALPKRGPIRFVRRRGRESSRARRGRRYPESGGEYWKAARFMAPPFRGPDREDRTGAL